MPGILKQPDIIVCHVIKLTFHCAGDEEKLRGQLEEGKQYRMLASEVRD